MDTTFANELEHVWGELFLAECSSIAEHSPHMDSEELEALAEKRVNEYLYFQERDLLPYYNNTLQWRRGLE